MNDGGFGTVLRLGLPDDRTTGLLRAALYSGHEGGEAWRAAEPWIQQLSVAYRNDLREAKNLVPLLAAAEARNGWPCAPATRTVLRTGLVREELRAKALGQVRAEVIQALTAEQLPFAVAGGAAAMHGLYDGMGPRHVHRIEVLVPSSSLEPAADVLRNAGLQALESRDPRFRHARHRTGVPIQVGSVLSRWQPSEFDATDLVARAGSGRTEESFGRSLAPTDLLLDACLRAFDPESHDRSLWAADAWLLLRRRQDLDWETLSELAECSRLWPLVWGTLQFLSVELQAPVPDHMLTRFREASARPATLGWDVALAQARREAGWRVIAGVARGWGQRLRVMLRLLLPSPAYVRTTRPVSHASALPWHYLHRLGSHLLRAGREAVWPGSSGSEALTRTAAGSGGAP